MTMRSQTSATPQERLDGGKSCQFPRRLFNEARTCFARGGPTGPEETDYVSVIARSSHLPPPSIRPSG
jgi:hypothetical protein